MRDIGKALRRRLLPVAVVAVAGMALSGCAIVDKIGEVAHNNLPSFGASGCKQISLKAQAKINWTRVPVVEVRVRNDEFSPMVFHLKQGRPYVLWIRNRDFKTHNFYAPDFFHDNAMVTMDVAGKRLDKTCVDSVSIPPRHSAEIRMVAIVDRHYDFYDNPLPFPIVSGLIPGGAIVVEERSDMAQTQ